MITRKFEVVFYLFGVNLGLLTVAFCSPIAAQTQQPYAGQVDLQLKRLQDDSSSTRSGAADALGVLRAYRAENALIDALADQSRLVRRQAAMALAWCGGRPAVLALLKSLEDEDWVTRQAAHVSLTNLTGMEFPFDSLAPPEQRGAETKVWRDWWDEFPVDRLPADVLKLLDEAVVTQSRWKVTASSSYKGPPDVLTDGIVHGAYWQTKNVSPPQWCTIDLGRIEDVSQVTVLQYGPEYVMTAYELATSIDNRTFEVLKKGKGETPVNLNIDFVPRKARYIRLTSLKAKRAIYPTTFFEILVNGETGAPNRNDDTLFWRAERSMRALGAIGGPGTPEAILRSLGPTPPTATASRPMIRAGIRALGRQRSEAGFQYLVSLLENTMWARNAAEALGDFGDRRAVPALLAAYPLYAKLLNGNDPSQVPHDDKMGFPSEDRMLETPYAIAFALCRLPLDDSQDLASLRRLSPQILANMPGDHDTFMLYECEVGHLVTRYLLEKSGLRQEACEQAMRLLGQPRRVPTVSADLNWPMFKPDRTASCIPTVCTENEDLPRLIALLEHDEGWVRINAAKALAWIDDKRAIKPIARILSQAKAEGEFGFSGTFKDEEFNDPAPRWREGLIRALGLLQAHPQTPLLISILNDQNSVLGVRHAAAVALADLGNEKALGALGVAAIKHDFLSVRQIARDALFVRGVKPPSQPLEEVESRPGHSTTGISTSSDDAHSFDAIVFIKGSNNIPNTLGTVEQADRWRQTYVVTDSGPVYRPGRNLHVLRPPVPDGIVTPLTRFTDGYVGEPELSWDASHVVFTYRGQDEPWWHVYRINIDGSGLKQLTNGPYHDVSPVYLPNGRLAFSTTRGGIRDEYHGYPCTALWVMDADGRNAQPISTNIGRDNEPAVLHDGRIVFSRLEVFYSRNKTELTLHAARPDGTQDVVLYGPERRQFWLSHDHGPRTPADGQQAPLTHRVLRMTQPQPMPDGRNIVVVTQGGLVMVGPQRGGETFITKNNKTRAYTTPLPLPDGRVLCASTLKASNRDEVDLGLYVLDPATKKLDLIYNDPATADFEPRPVVVRHRPPVVPDNTKPIDYAGRFVCSSVFATQDPEVARRGRLVRLVEGIPVVTRHSTQTNPHPVWQNHGGTMARVLGTAPLASDGSFHVEVPADRLLHFQVLDSDGHVVGNQLTWIYSRPGETRSCIGCHQKQDMTVHGKLPQALKSPPIKFLPSGDEFRYRAKAWFKGHLPPEIEQRTRTVRAVNLMGR